MAAVGPRGARDNDMIKHAIPDLQGSNLFDVLELDASSRKLRFQFSRGFVTKAQEFKGDKFAMIDTDIIAKLRSAPQVLFYSRAAMTGNMRYPSFYLPGISSETGAWKTSKRSWHRAAEKVGAVLDQEYLFLPELGQFSDEVTRVRVKVSSATTKWSAGKLYGRHSPAAVSVVHDGLARTLSKQELRNRAEWRTVSKAAGL